jgi:hypothetical protein
MGKLSVLGHLNTAVSGALVLILDQFSERRYFADTGESFAVFSSSLCYYLRAAGLLGPFYLQQFSFLF